MTNDCSSNVYDHGITISHITACIFFLNHSNPPSIIMIQFTCDDSCNQTSAIEQNLTHLF